MHICCTILILVPLIFMTDIKYLQCIFIDKNILVPFILSDSSWCEWRYFALFSSQLIWFIKTSVSLPQAHLILADLGYPFDVLWFTCSQTIWLLWSFGLWVYLLNGVPERRCMHWIIYTKRKMTPLRRLERRLLLLF